MTSLKPALLAAWIAPCIGLLWGDSIRDPYVRRRDARAVQQKGFVSRVLPRGELGDSKYIVFVPHVDPPSQSAKYPVIVFLNGGGENGDDGFLQISNNFGRPVWELQETFPFLVVAPQCAKSDAVQVDEIQKVSEILDAVLRDYNTDAERVYLTGVSSGAARVFAMLRRYPGRFAAAVPVSSPSAGDPAAVAQELASQNVPLWLFYNSDDSMADAANRSMRQAFHQHGVDYFATEYVQSGHDAWNYAYRDPAMYDWLLRHRRREPEREPTFGATDDRIVRVGKTAEVRFEATLQRPMHVILRPLGNDPSRTTGHQWSLPIAGFDDDRPEVDRPEVDRPEVDRLDDAGERKLSGAGELFGRIAIRPGSWNNIALVRRDGAIRLLVNGWTLYQLDDPIAEAIEVQIASGGSPPGSEADGIRHVRLRRKFAKGDEPQVADGKQIGYPWPGPAETEQLDDMTTIREALQRRADSVKDQRVTWSATNPFSLTPREAELVLGPPAATFTSQRRRVDDPNRTSAISLKQYRDYDFMGALGSQFRGPQAVAGPSLPFARTVSPDGWTDVWYGVDSVPLFTLQRDARSSDLTAWARLTPELDLENQLDTLCAQAALLGLGALDQPMLAVDISRLERSSDVELVHGFPCVGLVELDRLQFRAPLVSQPTVHLGQAVQKACETFGGPVARSTHARIPLVNVVGLRLTHRFAGLGEYEVLLFDRAAGTQEVDNIGEFTRSQRMSSG